MNGIAKVSKAAMTVEIDNYEGKKAESLQFSHFPEFSQLDRQLYDLVAKL